MKDSHDQGFLTLIIILYNFIGSSGGVMVNKLISYIIFYRVVSTLLTKHLLSPMLSIFPFSNDPSNGKIRPEHVGFGLPLPVF